MYLTLWYPVIHTSSCTNNYSPSQVKPQQFKSFLWARKDWNPSECGREIHRTLYKGQKSLIHEAYIQTLPADQHRNRTIFRLNQILPNFGWCFSTCIKLKDVSFTLTMSALLFPEKGCNGPHSLLETNQFHFPASDSLFCKSTYHQNLIQSPLWQA